MARLSLVMLLACIFNAHSLIAQDSSDLAGKVLSLPTRFINKIQHKYTHLNEQVSKRTERHLLRLAKQEDNLLRKLYKHNSKVSLPLNSGQKFYSELANKINTDNSSISGEYIPYLDSVQTTLAFLKQSDQLKSKSKELNQKIQGSLTQVKQFQGKLQQTERIKEYVKQRKNQIKEHLSQYSSLPNSIKKSYSEYSKELYYYTAQLKEYKEIANDPDKLTQKALAILRKSKAFQQFANQFGQLAGLFSLPADYGNVQNMGGLQTKLQIQHLISSAGKGATQVLSQNMQAAHAQLNDQIDNKLKSLGKGKADTDLPDFKPNNQKTKPFFKRLEYGTNLQTVKNNFFPTTSDLGLSVGYKLNDKSTVGIGASYKMGWGKDIKHIVITHQGMGLRSYLDIKLKGSFYASGGLECNYQPFHADSMSMPSMHWVNVSSWQKSGLVGISKIISIKSKFFKKTKLQLLWDFLSYQEVPRRQPIKFRVGYNF
jgi:hypothetical protein